MASAVVRVALVVVAVLAAAWLAVGVRALDLHSEAATSDDAGQAVDSLRGARLLSADKAPLLDEALVRFGTGQRAEGIATARHIVAEEPENIDAWLGLFFMYSASGDRIQASSTARRVRMLNPLIGDRLNEVRP